MRLRVYLNSLEPDEQCPWSLDFGSLETEQCYAAIELDCEGVTWRTSHNRSAAPGEPKCWLWAVPPVGMQFEICVNDGIAAVLLGKV